MANELKWAQDFLNANTPLYQQYEHYYSGNHPQPLLSDRLRRSGFGKLFSSYRDNLMKPVVDTLADRLQIVDFDAGSSATLINEIWNTNRMPRKSGRIHTQALKLGDSFVICWPDGTGYPRFHVQDTGAVAVRYGENEQIEEAVKAVSVDGYLIVYRYFADRIERYRAKDETVTSIPADIEELEPYDPDGQGYVVQNPYGRIPVFHFSNSMDPSSFAQSELSDAIPVQAHLNKTGLDLLVAQEMLAYPIRYLAGEFNNIDPATGKPKEITADPGAIIHIPTKEVLIGQFAAADLTQFLEIMDSARMEICRVSRTPAHAFMLNGGDFPSGQALRTAEAPLLAKVRDRQLAFGDTYEELMAFAATIAGTTIDPLQITTNWYTDESIYADPTPTAPESPSRDLTS